MRGVDSVRRLCSTRRSDFTWEIAPGVSRSHFGMGLYIASSILQQHGGKLVLQNRMDTHGGEVILEIPT